MLETQRTKDSSFSECLVFVRNIFEFKEASDCSFVVENNVESDDIVQLTLKILIEKR